MKKVAAFLLLALSLVACTSKSNPETERMLLQVLEQKDFFRLETLLKNKRAELSQGTALYIEAHLQNAFNRTEQSLQTLDVLFNHHAPSLNDTLCCAAFQVKYDNLYKQGRYSEAAEALKTAMDSYAHTLSSVGLSNLQEMYKAVEPLKAIPPQKMNITADVTIPIRRNQFNHVMMPVRGNGTSEDFVFDSGAMLSTISESCARRLGIRVMDAVLNVGNSTGSTVQSKVGVADSLRIGDLLVENIAFLVLPDVMLSFPQVGYVIHGIIGFPVMYQMKEVTICKDKSMTVAARPAKRNSHNLFLDGLSPFVRCEAAGDTVFFHMDMGANTTEFSEKYFATHKDDITKNARLKKVKRGGAGGIVEEEVYELDNVLLKIGGRELTLPTATVLTNKLSYLGGSDGTLGQDVLMHFNKLVLNFENMYLSLED